MLIIYYIICLVLNIFIVVEARKKTIPLYRAAVTWAQILIVAVSIPFYAGVFKLTIHPFAQVAVVTLSSLLLLLLFVWTVQMEDEAEGGLDFEVVLLTSFWVLILSLSIIFIPFEAIFRSLFLSSVLLFGMGYSLGSYKHNLTTRIVIEYVIITILFLAIGLIFIPS